MKKRPTLDESAFLEDAVANREEVVPRRRRSNMPAEGYQRTSFDLPTGLYEELRRAAWEQRRPQREIVEEALTEWLGRQ